MSAPTAEETTVERPPIALKKASRKYLARREDLWLTKKKDVPIMENGERVDYRIGERIGFTDGVLNVPLQGTFEGARGEDLDAAECIAWLEKHHLYGNREEGFWLQEEAAPPPSSQEQTALVELAEAADVDGIEDLIAQEEANWARPGFLEIARGTLERVQARLTES